MPEIVVETKVCAHCGVSFPITESDMEFYDKISPSIAGKKYLIPPPTKCPDCRRQMRLVQQNSRTLYKGKTTSGKNVISLFSPDKGFPIYTPEERLSEESDFRIYGAQLDMEKPFFPQLDALYDRVPKRNIILGSGSENCDYVNGVGGSNDSYLIFDCTEADHCYYSNSVNFDKYCVDCSYVKKSEQCYMDIDCENCCTTYYCQDCENCSESWYLSHCTNVHNCFACCNLNNVEYHIFNKAYTKEAYEQEKARLLQNFTMKDFLDFQKTCIVKNLTIINSEHASGDKIYNSKDIYNSYDISDCQNIHHSTMLINNASDCYDVDNVGNHISKIYCSSIINRSSTKVYFTYDCRSNCENLFYCISCKGCKNLFFCNGLVNKEYCILNTQYTKEAYELLAGQIIQGMMQTGEWGEFLPPKLSPFGYNETVAQERYPLTKEEALKQGFNRSDYEAPFPQVEKTLQANELPSIQEVTDTILQQAIICEISKKPFRIIQQELDFYRKHGLPLPTKHPDQRHKERMAMRNARKLRERNCAKCGIRMQTTYAPSRPEIVCCEECYNHEIYG